MNCGYNAQYLYAPYGVDPYSPIGATGATGPAGLSFMGAWSPSILYGIGSVVSYAGNAYYALATNQNAIPTQNPSIWTLFVPGGATGATGPSQAGDASFTNLGVSNNVSIGGGLRIALNSVVGDEGSTTVANETQAGGYVTFSSILIPAYSAVTLFVQNPYISASTVIIGAVIGYNGNFDYSSTTFPNLISMLPTDGGINVTVTNMSFGGVELTTDVTLWYLLVGGVSPSYLKSK